MLRQSLFVGLFAIMFAITPAIENAHAQSAQSEGQHARSLKDVKDAVLSATGYNGQAVEVSATNVQFVITLVNSKLLGRSAIERENEASHIASVIARTIADKPEFKGIQAIHVDYVQREPDGGPSRTIDGIDFRKDPQGNFQHHIT